MNSTNADLVGDQPTRQESGRPTRLAPRRLAAGLAVLFAYLVDSGQPWGYALVAGMLTLWAIYGVYRTIVQARAPKQYTDLV